MTKIKLMITLKNHITIILGKKVRLIHVYIKIRSLDFYTYKLGIFRKSLLFAIIQEYKDSEFRE